MWRLQDHMDRSINPQSKIILLLSNIRGSNGFPIHIGGRAAFHNISIISITGVPEVFQVRFFTLSAVGIFDRLGAGRRHSSLENCLMKQI